MRSLQASAQSHPAGWRSSREGCNSQSSGRTCALPPQFTRHGLICPKLPSEVLQRGFACIAK